VLDGGCLSGTISPIRPLFRLAQGGDVIVTIAKVADFDQFLKTFSTTGVAKRREHGCKGAHVFLDPDDRNRVWVFFDWAIEDYERFLSDPEVPAIAQQLALREPPVKANPIAQYDS
jgi:quinol monooxygenase YgiN